MSTPKFKTKLPHSVVEQDTVRFAEKQLWPRLCALAEGGEVPNWWYSGKMDTKELANTAAGTIEDLVVIIKRLTKNLKTCPKCGGTGSYTERMGGCRDDNESVVCDKCHGRYLSHNGRTTTE